MAEDRSVERRSKPPGSPEAVWFPATDLEGIVEGRIAALLGDRHDQRAASEGRRRAAAARRSRGQTGRNSADPGTDRSHRRIHPLESSSAPEGRRKDHHALGAGDPEAGMEDRPLVEATETRSSRKPDRRLLRLLARAHRFRDLILRGDGKSIAELAEENGVGRPYVSRNHRRGFLVPDITAAIFEGGQPIDLPPNSSRSRSTCRRTGTSSDGHRDMGDRSDRPNESRSDDPRDAGGDLRSDASASIDHGNRQGFMDWSASQGRCAANGTTKPASRDVRAGSAPGSASTGSRGPVARCGTAQVFERTALFGGVRKIGRTR